MSDVDDAFIRTAVEISDLMALRVALFQATGDAWLKDIGPIATISDEDKETLIEKAVAYLRDLPAGATLPTPTDAELRELMDLATGVPNTDEEFVARRGLASFDESPWAAQWPDGVQPELPEGFRVAIIGAGFSGIAAGHQMEELGIPYTIFERRHEVGGVWSSNPYPDARVDTASITYEYNFEKNYPWTEYFAKQPEVRGYLEHVAKKHGMWPNIEFNSELKLAEWDEAAAKWHFTFDRPDGTSFTFDANAVITGCGVFANPKHVDFPGREDFQGRIIHPTQWSPDIDLEGASVALIGNGSTGVQILKPIAQQAKQVFVYQRSAQWISPRPKYGALVEPETRWLLDTMPAYWNWAKYTSTSTLFNLHELMVSDPEWIAKGGRVSERNDGIATQLTGYIKSQLGGDEELYAKVAPDYAPMTRRPVVDNGWYAALTRDNVELVTDGITRLTPTGVETEDGTVRDVDLIVTATGYDIVKFLLPAEFIGRDGKQLHEVWASGDGPRAYLGMMVPGFPNMWMLYGPNSQPVSGGTSLPCWYQIWSSFAGQCLVEMVSEGRTQVEAKQAAYDAYNEALDAEAAGLVIMTDEASVAKNYYVNSEHKRLQMNSPFLSPTFHAMTSVPNWDDLELS